MTVEIRQLSGYASSYENILYTTQWGKTNGIGSIMFLEGDIANVLDADVEEDGEKDKVVIFTYPHNPSALVRGWAEKFENQIREIVLQENMGSIPIVLTESSVELLSLSHFTRFYPKEPLQDEMFIFDKGQKLDVTDIRVVTKIQRNGVGYDGLKMLAKASRTVILPAGAETDFGKILTVNLLEASMSGAFRNINQHVSGLKFPCRNGDSLATMFNAQKLVSIAEEKVNGRLVKKLGEVVMLPAPKEPVTEEAVESADDTQDIPEQFSRYSMSSMEEIMQRIIIDGVVNLTDLLERGIKSIIKVIGFTDMPIEVVQDIPMIKGRMCLYMGMVHVVCSEPEWEILKDGFEDSDHDLFHICTSDTFPRV